MTKGASTPDRSTRTVERRKQELLAARQQLAEIDEALLGVSGLTDGQVRQRALLQLTNHQDFGTSRSIAHILRSNVFTLFNAVVGISFISLLLLGQWKDALFGFAVVSNILIGVIQEFTSKRTLDRLALLNAPFSRVLRAGEVVQIPASELVVDDLLQLRAGDQVTADAKVLNSSDLLVDESLLTGESEAVAKNAGDALMAGSGIVLGSAAARVTGVGPESYGNRITLEARRYSMVSSELRNALQRVVYWISWGLLPVLLIALNGQLQAVGGWQSAFATGQWRPALVGAIAGVIAMVPQGLVLITSISFALSAVKLSRSNVLIQELPAVEGLARVDVICFDKTGTLTEGKMRFESAVELPGASQHDWRSVLGHFAHDAEANQTAAALQETFAPSNLVEKTRSPFSSQHKWSGFEFDNSAATAQTLGTKPLATETWILGAPEFLLTAAVNSTALNDANSLAQTGSRVLVLAYSDSPLTKGTLPQRLKPVTLLQFREKIRADAAETLAYFAEQQVSVRIISGDNPSTVAAVAQDAGLEIFGSPIDARELPTDLATLASILEANQIFGRVTPEQKRDMVKALQLRGHVVAMTGDGVNDALALKVADLGIAMGSGAAITRAVSRLVLLDGRFAILPSVVGEGRRVIANIERISRLFLTKTTWAISLATVFGLALWTFPFLPRQLSAIDGFTIGLPAFALALLPNNKRYTPGFLKRSLTFCLPAGLLVAVGVVGLSWLGRWLHWPDSAAQTSVCLLLSATGLWVLGSLARPLSSLKVGILAAMLTMFVVVFWWPLSRDFFGFVALDLAQLLVTAALAIPVLIAMEFAFRFAERKH